MHGTSLFLVFGLIECWNERAIRYCLDWPKNARRKFRMCRHFCSACGAQHARQHHCSRHARRIDKDGGRPRNDLFLGPIRATRFSVSMTSRRKQPTVVFWLTVALVTVLFGYPLSFGPACWISSRMQPSGRIVSAVYRPLIRAWDKAPPPVERLIARFVVFGTPKDFVHLTSRGRISFPTHGR